MDTSERNNTADLLSEALDGSAELTAAQPLPLIEQLVQKIELAEPTSAQAMINKVAEATEHSRTIERNLERKHEVKDFAATKIQKAQLETQVGTIIGVSHQPVTQRATNQMSATNRHGQSPLYKFMHDQSLNGYAIRYGSFATLLALATATFITIVLF